VPSPRWRVVLWVYVAVAAEWWAGRHLHLVRCLIGAQRSVDPLETSCSDPHAGSAAWGGRAASGVSSHCSELLAGVRGPAQVFSYALVRWSLRLQLKCLFGRAAIAWVGGYLGVLASSNPSGIPAGVGAPEIIGGSRSAGHMVGLDSEYRLYDIDRIISRSPGLCGVDRPSDRGVPAVALATRVWSVH